ncbi:MAG: tRNA (adenosine(37)-N6)-dimethylallyltransferase MiaA [Candidatus Eremiobacteraeota bacterium]|nr:tRNA (adenosine(37)-N6)-dimethylallyltransferase MiaA [Candidatus Eremiobacteraeota bacterium]
MSDDSAVLIIAGPTASGKTELAIQLAREFDAEVVGADSRQIYAGMPIGTASPSVRQQAEVPHHLIGFLDPRRRYSAAQYAEDAIAALIAIRARGKRAIVAGGTGFYIRALMGGVALAPQYDEPLRNRLAREALLHPSEFLHEWLGCRDAARAGALEKNDTYRVLRALEIALAPAALVRDAATRTLSSEGFRYELVFLDVDRATLDERIERRTARMLDDGLIEEAERIGDGVVAASAVGYPQAHAYLRGWSTLAELRSSLTRATRRYARRQRAWFRGEPSTLWLPAEAVRSVVREKLGWSSKRAV